MIAFRDYPIKQKLVALILVLAASAILLSSVLLVIFESVLFYRDVTDDLTTFSQVIADNSTAALAFADADAAAETLATLRARRRVITACLFRKDGLLLAEYRRDGVGRSCGSSYAGQSSMISTLTEVTLSRPVSLRQQKIGSLTIVYDLGELKGRIQMWAVMVFCVLALCSGAVVLLSAPLRRLFVTPILDLVESAHCVSRTKNYSIRACEQSRDEVGQLAGAFNQMLSDIELREAELQQTLKEREDALSRLSQANRELKEANEQLARSNQDLERFAFIASHDMQEPLRMVTIYAELLVRRCGISDNGLLTQYSRYISEGTGRMRRLIADLLSYVQVTTERCDAMPVDLNTAVQKAQENLGMLIQEAGAVITIERLPVVVGYESQIVSVLQNLISNGIKYRSEKLPVIGISSERFGSECRVHVTDNGVGIAPEYHQQIFVAFKRLHDKTIEGTGIGLAICQRIIERHGGRIWVESQMGQGSSFKFTLPLALDSQKPDGYATTRLSKSSDMSK